MRPTAPGAASAPFTHQVPQLSATARAVRQALWLMLAAAPVAVYSPVALAQAVRPQGADAASTAAESAPRTYDIPAGPLTAALKRFGLEAGILLSFSTEQTSGLQTPGLSGRHTVANALQALLAGTELAAVRQESGGWLLVRRPAQPTAATTSAPETVLPVIRVKASTRAGANLEGGAAEGYRVSKNAVGGFGEQSTLDTPFTVNALPAELLLNQKIEDISSLDRLAASITASAASPGTYSQTYVRGLALNSYSNYRFNGLTFLNFQKVGLENKQNVELLSGLSALQAGFSSPGGIINYVTKRPVAVPVNDVSFSVDRFGDAKVAMDLSRRSADSRFGLRINAAVEELRSYVQDADGDRRFVSLAADWRIAPQTNLQMDLEHERRKQAFQALLFQNVDGRLPSRISPRTFLGQDWAKIETQYTMLSAKLDHALNDQWSLGLEGNWARQERDQNTIILDALQPNGDADVYNFFAPDQRYTPGSVRVSAKGQFNTGAIGHELVFGYSYLRTTTSWADYAFDFLGTTNIYAPQRLTNPNFPTGPINLVEKIHERGVFFNDIISFSDAWKLHVGGRYASREQASFTSTGEVDGEPYNKNVFTPSVALVFKPAQNISTYVSYIEGLENGGTAPLGTANQTQQLKPLTSKQIETGVKADLGKVQAEFALFQIDRAAEYTNSGNVFVQDGQQRHRGFGVSLSGRLAAEWTLVGSALLLDAKLKETGDPLTQGKRPYGVPKQRFVLIPEYAPRALPDWAFSGNWTYTGKRELNDLNTGEAASGYSVFGLGARYELHVGGTPMTIRVNVDNVFDKNYWASANGAVVAGSPRTLSAGLTVRF